MTTKEERQDRHSKQADKLKHTSAMRKLIVAACVICIHIAAVTAVTCALFGFAPGALTATKIALIVGGALLLSFAEMGVWEVAKQRQRMDSAHNKISVRGLLNALLGGGDPK
ncbi:MAG: hypothetical protein JO126_02380 [Alphaproteobacteria bacterium]|nr:hypothetical protein [Alphaproteobacteria bacterium]MBV8548287.1 hypothetical protein [Alphaproteobacteria bacterium]